MYSKYLAEHNYTKPSKTAILGWSAGAELVAQSIQRAPAGTFGAAVADRGPHDGLRVRTQRVAALTNKHH